MCAAEHGHADVVRLLLSHPDCDPSILDNVCFNESMNQWKL